VASYAVTKGLEVIARVNEFILPAGIGILAFLAIVNIHESDVRNFLPIMTNGILPPVKGGILIQSWLLEIVIILQLVPYVRDKKNIKKYTAISVGILGLSMALGVLIFAVFGRMTGRLLFPAFRQHRRICQES